MTDLVQQLRAALAELVSIAEGSLSTPRSMESALRHVRQRAAGLAPVVEHVDLQVNAVKRFWDTGELESLKDGRLVSFGAVLQAGPGRARLIEDRERFSTLLSGVDRWQQEPRRFRRCYQGLIASYFAYDGYSDTTPESGKENWEELRGFLGDRWPRISTGDLDPDWVVCVNSNRQLFGHRPCDLYAHDLLRGDRTRVDQIRTLLMIDNASWFSRELVMGQLRSIVAETDSVFISRLSDAIGLLMGNEVVRDRGLSLILDRYAAMPSPQLSALLRDSAVSWWGNPWITSNRMRWGSVTDAAREMVADWLKLDLIERFFTLLAEEGTGDRRRLEFWKRYVKVIEDMHFALGSDAFFSTQRDFVELRPKMAGRVVRLLDSVPSSNAFVMKLGNLIAVEFSGQGNALYGYDQRQGLPFDLAKSVHSTTTAKNTLKSPKRQLWLKHIDGADRWEDAFERKLRNDYGIIPMGGSDVIARSSGRAVAMNLAPEPRPEKDWKKVRYTEEGLREFASAHGLRVEDHRFKGGSLWVRSVFLPEVDRVLAPWGFKFKATKGWWK